MRATELVLEMLENETLFNGHLHQYSRVNAARVRAISFGPPPRTSCMHRASCIMPSRGKDTSHHDRHTYLDDYRLRRMQGKKGPKVNNYITRYSKTGASSRDVDSGQSTTHRKHDNTGEKGRKNNCASDMGGEKDVRSIIHYASKTKTRKKEM